MPKPEIHNEELACPSSREDSPQSAVFGIIDNRGDFPVVRYLDRTVPATPEVMALIQGEHPNQVFRFTSPCQEARCAHFSQGQCGLPGFLKNHLPAVRSKHAPCPIRNRCRWFHQESFSACERCPVIVTAEYTLVDGQLLSPFDPPQPPQEASTAKEQGNSIEERNRP
jgi:hypothetical protein